MLLDHGAAQAQTQAHSLVARGEERRVELLGHLVRNAHPQIGDHKLHPRAPGGARGLLHVNAQHALADVDALHGLHAIAAEVEQHLLDHGAVAIHGGQVSGHLGEHLHLQFTRLQAHQRQDGVDQLLRQQQLARLPPTAYRVMHALDDLARALGLEGHALHGHAHIGQKLLQRIGLCIVGQQVQGTGGVAADGGQGLVQLMAQQRRHLAHHGQAGRGLQALLRGARQLLYPALLAHVDKGAHPARVHARCIDQRRLKHQHGEAHAILAHKGGLIALTRGRQLARQADALAPRVLRRQLGRPVRGGDAGVQNLLGRKTHHLAKRRVDVGGLTLQVTRTQAGDQRILHRLSKCQGIAQIALSFQAPAVVAHQHHQHSHQGDGHAGDQRRHHVREDIGRGMPAVYPQNQGHAW